MVKKITILLVLQYFLSNKCSLGEYKRHLKKSYRPQTFEELKFIEIFLNSVSDIL